MQPVISLEPEPESSECTPAAHSTETSECTHGKWLLLYYFLPHKGSVKMAGVTRPGFVFSMSVRCARAFLWLARLT